MPDVQRFPFVEARDGFGDIDVVPRLPLRLSYGDRQVEASGLLDTGASVSVLPCVLVIRTHELFSEFDVCFYRSRLLFEVRQKELLALPTSSNPAIVN